VKGKEGPRFIVVVVATRSVPQGRNRDNIFYFLIIIQSLAAKVI
jgi:hypothetical protein